MYKQRQNQRTTVQFHQLSRKSYSVFCSLKKEVRIGALTFATLAFANTGSVSAQTVHHVSENRQIADVEMQEVEVTASRVPLTLNQAARTVTVLDRKAIAAAPVQSVNDLLKYVIGVDVRQRGDLGIQTDISIRGGTFDQITLLLNGVNICDPQTGHNAADFPVDLNDIERIEILEGPAGRVYGTSSLLGAINIVTKTDTQSHLAAQVEGGSYGLIGGGARFNYTKGKVSNQLSGSLNRSDGATDNSDFKTQRAFYQGAFTHEQVDVKWQAGYSNKDYGANTFYSAKYANQFEHTRKYFASVQAETKGILHLLPSVYWTQADDRFELIRGDESKVPFNYHRTTTYGVNLNSYFTSSLGKTAFGTEVRNEDVISTVLGEPLKKPENISHSERLYDKGRNRTHISFHAEHTLLLSQFTLSAGVIATMNTDWDKEFHFFPGIDASYWFSQNLKAYASWSTSLRMPTFTELYYSTNETHQGNKDLTPEKMQAYEVGLKYLTPGIQTTLSVYHHRGKDLIDWVRPVDESIYYSMNHTRINTTGVEVSSLFNLKELVNRNFPFTSLYIGYSYINRDKKENTAYESLYALEYLRHKFVARLDHKIWKQLTASWAFRWQERMGHYMDYSDNTDGVQHTYRPYSLLDVKVQWTAPAYQLYVEANNLFNKTYYDHGNIPQPGIWVRGGISYRFNL